MAELQRKNRIAMAGLIFLGAISIMTSVGWVDARGKSYHLREAWDILEAGFAPRTSSYSVSPYLMEWRLDDGTILMINLPSFPESGAV